MSVVRYFRIGRDLSKLARSIQVNAVVAVESARFREKYPKVFDGDLSKPVKDYEVHLHLMDDPKPKPIFRKAYDAPIRLRTKVELTIEELIAKGILEPIDGAEWASPMVTVVKPTGEVRLCIDPSKSLNPYLVYDHYPVPVIVEMLFKIGSHYFYSILDLKGAYQQLSVDKCSRKLLAVNTIKGVFQFTRLPFGIKAASSLFQRYMDQLLEGISWASAYVDEVIIVAETLEEMKQRLDIIFGKFAESGVKVNLQKCR